MTKVNMKLCFKMNELDLLECNILEYNFTILYEHFVCFNFFLLSFIKKVKLF